MCADARTPDVSVIIPCRNEGRFIRSCLKSILENRLEGGSFEVIVADGLSTDETRQQIGELAGAYPELRMIDNPFLTTPAALNRLIAAARGQYLVRFDAHSEMPQGYIARCIELLQTTGAWNAGGICITLPRMDSAMARAIARATTHWFGVGGSPFRCGAAAGPADTVVFGAFPRWVFDEIGGFDERLVRNQDNELNSRIRAHGGLVWLDPEIKVRYYNQATLPGLIRQAFGTGKWNVFTARLAPHAARFRHLAPGAFAGGVLIAGVLAAAGVLAMNAWVVAMALALVAPYFVVLSAVSVTQAAGRDWGEAWRIPLVFVAYHFTYGCGILAGVLLLLTGRWKHHVPEAVPVGAAGFVRQSYGDPSHAKRTSKRSQAGA